MKPAAFTAWQPQIGGERYADAIAARSARAAAAEAAARAIRARYADLRTPFEIAVRDAHGHAQRFRCSAGAQSFEPLRTCRVCACVDDDACEDGCCWIADDLCSACEARA